MSKLHRRRENTKRIGEAESMIYYGLVMRLSQEQRRIILNFLENQEVRVLDETIDPAPLRIVRTGTPERFAEATQR